MRKKKKRINLEKENKKKIKISNQKISIKN